MILSLFFFSPDLENRCSEYSILSFCLICHPMRFIQIYHIHHHSPQTSASFLYTAAKRDMHQKPTIREVEGLKKPEGISEGARKINSVFEFSFCLLRSPGNVEHVIFAIYTFFNVIYPYPFTTEFLLFTL